MLHNRECAHHTHRAVVPYRAVVLKFVVLIGDKFDGLGFSTLNYFRAYIKRVQYEIMRALDVVEYDAYRIPLLYSDFIGDEFERASFNGELSHSRFGW